MAVIESSNTNFAGQPVPDRTAPRVLHNGDLHNRFLAFIARVVKKPIMTVRLLSIKIHSGFGHSVRTALTVLTYRDPYLANNPCCQATTDHTKYQCFCFIETSLLERLMTSCNTYSRDPRGSYDSDLLTKLVNNYRSHKNIIEIPNELFYDNELKECAGDFR